MNIKHTNLSASFSYVNQQIKLIGFEGFNIYTIDSVKDNKMREDLYYRFQGFLIHLPPLREGDNELLLITRFILKDFCKQNNIPQKSFSSDSLKAMIKHPWSGNIRELKAFIERAVLISDGDVIEEEDLIFSQDI